MYCQGDCGEKVYLTRKVRERERERALFGVWKQVRLPKVGIYNQAVSKALFAE